MAKRTDQHWYAAHNARQRQDTLPRVQPPLNSGELIFPFARSTWSPPSVRSALTFALCAISFALGACLGVLH